MRIVFMGSGSFACPVVAALLERHGADVIGVVTQPDRPKGRNRVPAPCPVKERAAGRGPRILTPEKISEAAEELRAMAPDLIVVADYGQYIPQAVLAIPPMRAINVHPSLLPRYRGAAPIQWALAHGDTVTGVTVQYVAKKMDAGDILLQQEFEIGAEETAADLEARLAQAGGELALRAIELIASGHVHATPQDEAAATHARKLTKEDGRIDWGKPAAVIRNRIRAFHPWPGSYTTFQGTQIKVLTVALEPSSGGTHRASVLSLGADGPVIGTGEGALRLVTVQPEGRKPMPGADWARGARVNIGDCMV
jgi:methionyl-tRNA formyltransferase